jgi:hypothetical protein
VLVAAILAYVTVSLGMAATQEKGSPSPDAPDRPTPHSTMAAFLEATSSHDYRRTAEYLDLSRSGTGPRAGAAHHP